MCVFSQVIVDLYLVCCLEALIDLEVWGACLKHLDTRIVVKINFLFLSHLLLGVEDGVGVGGNALHSHSVPGAAAGGWSQDLNLMGDKSSNKF